MKILAVSLLVFNLLFFCSCSVKNPKSPTARQDWNNEIIYHVFQRSFYDSNGDKHGDLKGFTEKLGYLKELGITTILFTPLYESDFYHNYFARDYERIDPEYGTMDDYLTFIKAVHQNGLKFMMDMETQYAQNGNKWLVDSYKRPASPNSGFVCYSDSLQQYPEQFYVPSGSDLFYFKAWPDQKLNIVYLDLNSQKAKDWTKAFYAHWVDPNGDGKFDDGVDGFRIDHMMDDLDNKKLFTHLFTNFWYPVFQYCKTINPNLFVVGEQSNWAEYGDDMIVQGGINASFGFPVYFAIAGALADFGKDQAGQTRENNLNAENIGKQVELTLQRIPVGKNYISFIENHDTERFASVVKMDKSKLFCGALLNILLPGIPSIYYGQELGVTGKIGNWGYDANHIPVREAFPWTPDPNEPGTALFYKDTGPWWDQSYFNTGEANKLALSIQKKDPSSLWNFYRRLIHFRQSRVAVRTGDFKQIQTGKPFLLAFSRETPNEKVVVMLNLSGNSVKMRSLSAKKYDFIEKTEIRGDSIVFQPYGIVVCTE